jgi:V/A-type H+-transporting ATPase subunit I
LLRPVRMCGIGCLTLSDRKEALVDALRSTGVVQLDCLDDDYLRELSLDRGRPLERVERVSELLFNVNSVVEALGVFHDPKTNFIEDVLNVDKTPRTGVDLSSGEVVEESSALLDGIQREVELLSSNIAELKSRIKDIGDMVSRYSIFRGFDFSMKYAGGSDFLFVAVGSLPADILEGVESKLKEVFGGEYLSVYGGGDEKIPAAVCVMRSMEKELNEVLNQYRFEFIKEYLGESVLGTLSERLQETLKALEKTLEEKSRQLLGLYSKHYSKLIVYRELLEVEKKRCEVYVNMAATRRAVYMRLWTPRKHCDRILKIIDEKTAGINSTEVDWNPVDAPVLLDNPPLIRSFELITNLFSPPLYNQLDPTLFIAPTFILFSGIMIGDFPYGIFLTLVSLLFYKMYGSYRKSIRDFFTILALVGVSTAFGGILTGSYFGNFIPEYVLGKTQNDIAVVFDPMYGENMLNVLVITCVIGLLHIFTGYALGFYDSLMNKDYRTAVLKYLAWFFIGFGGLATALTMNPVAVAVMALGLTALLIYSGPIGFYMQVSGLIGNTLSYARIMALLLTTAGIAFTVNMLCYMVYQIPVVGIIIAAIIFIVGHLMNTLMNLMGAFVHTLRLHYVEFFNTFYTGGGEEFSPLKDDRKYTYTTT